VEASTIHASAGLGRSRVLALTTPLLRLRSDQQLVGLFRSGNDDAFRVIHDRYRARLLAYVRQMLTGSNPDAEDVLQDVFVRAYAGLRANGRELSLRAWLYRIAHNRCVDELRRPMPPAPEAADLAQAAMSDPVLESEQRESLRRLIMDIRRLPDQQRSALLMREMSGMAYAEISGVLGLSVPAVKSLLVRARVGLAAALEARDTACQEIRAELADAHDRGVRPSGLARRHLHDCSGCRDYRSELRRVSGGLAALTPAIGPLGALARLLGVGSGGGAAAGGTGSGVAAFGGTATAGGTFLGVTTSHVAAVVAAAVVTTGGALEVQQTVAAQLARASVHHHKRTVSVGQTKSTEGTAAATVAATVAASVSSPLPSAAPTVAQQTPAPTGHAQRHHGRRIATQRPASTASSTCVNALAATAPQPCDDHAATQTPAASSNSGSPLPGCQSTTTPPITTSACTSSATTTNGGRSSTSTSPPPAGGYDPAGAGSATTGTPVGSTSGSGSPSGTGSTPPPQQT
jgi:RNA polymerase sigma factor (sigma-70 family)